MRVSESGISEGSIASTNRGGTGANFPPVCARLLRHTAQTRPVCKYVSTLDAPDPWVCRLPYIQLADLRTISPLGNEDSSFAADYPGSIDRASTRAIRR